MGKYTTHCEERSIKDLTPHSFEVFLYTLRCYLQNVNKIKPARGL